MATEEKLLIGVGIFVGILIGGFIGALAGKFLL